VRRAESYPSRRAHFIYVSDFDKARRNMPVQLARNCQFWARRLGLEVTVTLEPVALTREQIAEFGLPEAPDTKNVELDALQAYRPGELARLVTEAVQRQRDPGLPERLAAAWNKALEAAGSSGRRRPQTWRRA
jgi:hypothetical protein